MKMITKSFYLLLLSIFLIGEILAQPAPPINLTAVQNTWKGYIFVKLDWQRIDMKMASEYFNIYRKEVSLSDSGGFHKIYSRIPVTMWVDKFVHRGASYLYYVTAVNKDGESSPSDTAEVSLDSTAVKAFVYGTLKNSVTLESVQHGKISFIPIFGWGLTNVRTDSLGNYSAHLFPGNYILLSNAPGYFPEFYNDARYIFNATKINLHEGDSININISLEPRPSLRKFVLSGSVKDSSGNPVSAMIELYNVSANSFHRKIYHSITDSSGNYSVHVREGDTLVVYAHALNRKYFPQFYNNEYSFLTADRIGISSDTANINFILIHKPSFENGISGVVKNNDDFGIQSIILAIRLGVKSDNRKYSTFSDSLGNYSFSNLYPGSYILLTIPEGDYIPTFFRYDGMQTLNWKSADSVVVGPSGIISGINFIVNNIPDSGEAVVNGRVIDNSNNPVPGALVFAADDNQQVYSFGVTDANGNYTIAGLVPGSYSVSSSSFGYSDANAENVSLDYNTNYSSEASFTLTTEFATGVNNNQVSVNSFELSQNYPNPFNPSTIIKFRIPIQSKVTLKIYNILGSEVATLLNEEKPAGTYNVKFNAGKLASGVYFYQLKATINGSKTGGFVTTRKLMILK